MWRCRTAIEPLPNTARPGCGSASRGDRDWGTQANMARAEQEDVPYLFKLRMTPRVKKTVERLMRGADRSAAGQGWPGAETRLRPAGWSRPRRTIVLRRPISP